MKYSGNIFRRRKFYIIVFSLIIFSMFCLFLSKKRPPFSNRIDFIENFSSAVKNGFKEETDIDKYLPANSLAFDISQIKDINVKLFSGNSVQLSKDGINIGEYKDKVTAGGFRTVFKKLPDKPSTFSYYIKKSDSDIYWTITLVTGEKTILEIKEIADSISSTIDRMEIPFTAKTSNKLNILFVNDFLIVFTDQQVLFQCKHPELDGKSYIDFKYGGSWNGPEYSVKFNVMDETLKKTFLEKIKTQFPLMRIHKYKYSDPPWNLLGSEDRLIETDIKSRYLRRLKLEDTTMPSIYFLPGTSLEYKVKVPGNSRLSFYLAFYYPFGSQISADKFLIKIFSDRKNIRDDYEFNCKNYVSDKPNFKRFSIDLKKYAGAECSVVFKFEAKKPRMRELFATSPIIALGSPVIYPPRERKEKNVILISIDTLRPDHLGCYGYKRDTSPVMDKFARNSILFLNATAQSDWTLTSHMSLFASQFPFETGYHKGIDVHQNVRFSGKVKLFPEYLKESGYKTGAITAGGYVSEYFGFDRGIDYYHIIEKDCSRTMTKAIEWLEESENSKFFLFFHTYEVHKPYNHDDFVSELDTKAATELEQTIARYDSGIRYTDHQMGRLFDWLRKKNLYRNTLIIIVSDHGENFDIIDREKIPGGHGVTLYDSEIQVPLIIGGGIDGETGRAIKNQVSLVDVAPTLLDLLGMPVPADIRGISLKDLIEGNEKENMLAYSEAVFGPGEKKALRGIQHKLIKNLMNEKDKIKTGYEFYNLAEDRNERKNIINNNIPIKNVFKARLDKIIHEVNEKYKALAIKTGGTPAGNKNLEEQLKALGYLGN